MTEKTHSRLFSPALWSVAAVVVSVAYFVMLLYLMSIGLTKEPETIIGRAIYLIIESVFLPFAFVGAGVCVTALVIDAQRHKWIWFGVVVFFSFLFLSHLWLLVSENIQAMRAR